MSNTVNNEWVRGNEAVPGTPAKGYTYIDMEWNQPSDDSNHTEILSPVIQVPFRGDILTFIINTEAVDTSTSADLTLNVYGAAVNHSTLSKWDILHTAAIGNASFDGITYKYMYDTDTRGLLPYMKIGIDPSADLGAVDIRVAIIPNNTGV